MTADCITIRGKRLSAAINPLGAELSSVTDADGRELMTDADPQFWTGRAPLLFPIVGALASDRYLVNGESYSMPQHGIARRQPFELVEQTSDRVHFRLVDNATTRAAFPFAFALDVEFHLSEASLSVTVNAANRGAADMPCSFGFHPAFSWPLPYGADRADHAIVFAQRQPRDLCVLQDGLIGSQHRPGPLVDGRTLALSDALFNDGALIWRTTDSRACSYGPPGGPHLRCEWSDTLPALGIWTKPGAAFICIEPWDGIADPADFTGEIWDKPGIHRLAPGETREWSMRVTLES